MGGGGLAFLNKKPWHTSTIRVCCPSSSFFPVWVCSCEWVGRSVSWEEKALLWNDGTVVKALNVAFLYCTAHTPTSFTTTPPTLLSHPLYSTLPSTLHERAELYYSYYFSPFTFIDPLILQNTVLVLYSSAVCWILLSDCPIRFILTNCVIAECWESLEGWASGWKWKEANEWYVCFQWTHLGCVAPPMSPLMRKKDFWWKLLDATQNAHNTNAFLKARQVVPVFWQEMCVFAL